MALRNRRLAELALFLALTILHTWPLATDPARLSRLDNDDTAFNTWVVAWVQHALLHDPLNLFQAPAFHPERDTLAYSEHMTVQAVLGLPFHLAGASPVLVYNLLVMLGFLLSGIAMCRLMTAWTGSFAAGIIAGALFAFNTHVFTRIPHMQALHVEFIPLVLYAFDRVLSQARVRDAILLAAAFALQALCSNYLMVMLAVGLAAAAAVRREAWTSARVWGLLVLAAALAGAALLPFLLPYYRLHETQGLNRTIEDVRRYSAWWQDYLSTVGRLHYDWWSHRFIVANRTALFPGVTAVLLAIVALATRAAWRDPRARMMLPIAVVGVVLSLGANLSLYGWLQANVPAFQGMRAAGRWGYLALVAVAVLAGYGVAQLETRWKARRWWPAAAGALLVLVTVEVMRAPLPLVSFNGIPRVFRQLTRPDIGAIVVYPLYQWSSFFGNARYMLYQTAHWKPMLNGYSSFAPQSYFERAARFNNFPAPEVIAEMKSIGITHVVIERARIESMVGPQVLIDLRTNQDLAFEGEVEGWIVYRLR